MAYETLILESDGSIARVWLNRPQQHNPLSALVLEELIAASPPADPLIFLKGWQQRTQPSEPAA